MYLCYIDESGTPDIPGNTSHFVLCGIAIPVWNWRDVEREITKVLRPFGLEHVEFHTAWLMRSYLEQRRIPNFAAMTWAQRRSAVDKERNTNLLNLQKTNKHVLYKQTKKNYKHTLPYVHLTFDERKLAVEGIADCISGWGFARLFAECVDKLHFDKTKANRTIDEQAFEQVISRFETYISKMPPPSANHQNFGLVVHDRNDTVATKHTKMMRDFHNNGTLWTAINHIVDTPFFVDSSLTRMVQIADVCAWGLRRYCENSETTIFQKVFTRADRFFNKTVGVRHYSNLGCACLICAGHR